MAFDQHRVPVEQLRWTCDSALLDFATTEDLPDLDYAIGQKRALRSPSRKVP